MTLFSDKTDTELYEHAKKFAAAQQQMAADSKEDFTHWHHVAVAELIMELARRLTRQKDSQPVTGPELAADLTNEALADLIHDLSDILHKRLQTRPQEGSGLKHQLDNARLEVRSWPSSRQQQLKDSSSR